MNDEQNSNNANTLLGAEREFEIWSEGYAATGERSGAIYFGKSIGKTFEDACLNFEFKEDKWSDWGGVKIHSKGDKLPLDKNEDGSLDLFGGKPSSWACRYFDNETDARKSFG